MLHKPPPGQWVKEIVGGKGHNFDSAKVCGPLHHLLIIGSSTVVGVSPPTGLGPKLVIHLSLQKRSSPQLAKQLPNVSLGFGVGVGKTTVSSHKPVL
jgi:hypothetical protein